MLENAMRANSISGSDSRVVAESAAERAAVGHKFFGAPRSHAAVTGLDGAKVVPALTVVESIAFSEEMIRQQLVRVLQSSFFVQSEKLSRFLQFVVENAVAGKQKQVKEYLIGCEVYGRKPPYDPGVDSIVRTEARRLRSKLKEYYESEGRNDAVCISLHPGSYSPIFQSKAALMAIQRPQKVHEPVVIAKPAAVAIFPFADLSESLLSSKYARGISEELGFMLLCAHGCRVITPAFATHLSAQPQATAAAMRSVGANVAFEGSVREEDHRIRVIARILDETGFHLWATRFDVDASAHTRFALEEQVVAALSAAYIALFGASEVCG